MSQSHERLSAALADRYRLERELGQGGMATVYLAEDLKHNRKVAIKVLKPELAAVLGAERFVQEIATTAALQHPNILPLFDSGSADGFLYYVMPYVEGETLRAKLDRETQLGVGEAVQLVREVADALQYAHEHGVVHRDIKPENILLHAGRPMVADFGIALAVSAAAGGRMTETGLSLGTPHYMSPEQAAAERNITARSDIYSLASVLYEVLTGEPPHTGTSAQQIIMKIIAEPVPPVTSLRKSVPPNVAAALAQALEKLPADRFETVRAFSQALANPAFTTAREAPPGTAALTPGARRRSRRRIVATGAAGVAIGLAAGWLGRPRPAPTRQVRYYLAGDSARALTGAFALSPDGTTLVYRAVTPDGPLLFRQRLSDFDPSPIPGTSDAVDGPGAVFFSPDGTWIGYATGSAIRKIRLEGSEQQTVATYAGLFSGATWGADGFITYAVYPDTVLQRVAATGGTPVPVPVRSGSGAMTPLSPHLLPGAGRLLCVNLSASGGPRIGVLNLASGEFKPLVAGVSPTYLHGTLVYGRPDGSIMVQPFDPSRADTTGPATQLLLNVEQFFGRAPATGLFANFDASAAGVLVYQPRPVGMLQLVQRDGAGRVLVSGRSWGPRFSPDGRGIAFGSYVTGLTLADVYTFDLAAKTEQRLTSGGQTGRDYNDPTWSPDGKWIALSGLDSAKASGKHLYLVRSNASAPPTRLLQRPGDQWPTDWTKDGKTVLFTDQAPDGKRSIWLVPAFEGGTAAPVVATRYNALGGRLSPDGRWLAYESDETGQPEIYVQPFPGPGPRIRVSLSGGEFPVWSHGGRELFYWFGDQLMTADLQLGGEASVTARTVLFRASLPVGTVLAQYDVQPGDQRFVISMVPTASNRLAVITGMAEPLTR